MRYAINRESSAFAELERLQSDFPRWVFSLDVSRLDPFRAHRKLVGISGGPLAIGAKSPQLMRALMHEQQARDVPYRVHDGWPADPHEITPTCLPSCIGVLTIADLAEYVRNQIHEAT
ncbi:hypothetical protein GCM10010411_78240 [Actinomadura fulvescens]|uniref:Uncharacterized protein n=1 Tax=Actinomadura fulvescens TaxID=46160 RepID=A0ABP6CYK2_9ACTN